MIDNNIYTSISHDQNSHPMAVQYTGHMKQRETRVKNTVTYERKVNK